MIYFLGEINARKKDSLQFLIKHKPGSFESSSDCPADEKRSKSACVLLTDECEEDKKSYYGVYRKDISNLKSLLPARAFTAENERALD